MELKHIESGENLFTLIHVKCDFHNAGSQVKDLRREKAINQKDGRSAKRLRECFWD